jgi:hypothetical protein
LTLLNQSRIDIIILMSDPKHKHTWGSQSYYDYVKKYDSRFLNKYQSHSHWYAARSSGFMELLRMKAVRLKSNRNWMWFDVRYGVKFLYIFYMPMLFFVAGSYALTPAWRRGDERYMLRFNDVDVDETDDTENYVDYMQRKKPMTRRKYSDSIKIVYNGEEDWDYVPEAPLRYR